MIGEDMATLKAQIFKALSDRSRITILEVLTEKGWMSVSDICQMTEIGKQVFYALNRETAEKLLFISENPVRSMAEKVISEQV